MKRITESDIEYSKRSLMDTAGRVFFYEDRVFRTICSEKDASLYRELLKQNWIDSVFKSGLIKTWISNELEICGVPLILEHEKVSFTTVPCEWTSYMFWSAAKMMININIKLSKYGFNLKDSHLSNVLYHFGFPTFVDFGSIIQSKCVSQAWLNEFIKYVGVPIWLNTTKWRDLAIEYKKEHITGFGINLFKKKYVRYLFLYNLVKLRRFLDNPFLFFNRLSLWLDNHFPVPPLKEKWAKYDQSHNITITENDNYALTIKQKFVLDILNKNKPRTVLDCASNKGFYAEMAARSGASVVAFDCEEFCVDQCLGKVQKEKLDIVPIFMDFKMPTRNFGHGLVVDDAFVRFNVDIIMALGLIHHVCLKSNLPVSLFCDICSKYAKKGVILEFVETDDKHVVNWKLKKIPVDYNITLISQFFSRKFPFRAIVENNIDGLHRKLVYYYNNM